MLTQAAALVLAAVTLISVYLLARPIAVLLAASIVAVALAPLVELLEQRLPRGIAVVTVYSGLAALVSALVIIAGLIVADEASRMIEQVPDDRRQLEALINHHDPIGDDRVVDLINSRSESLSSIAFSVPRLVATALLEMVIAAFLSVYCLLAAPVLRKTALSVFANDDRRQRADEVVTAIVERMGGYVRAIAIDGLILAVVTFIGLSIMGVRFSLVLAIISGLSVLIPILGPVIAVVPAILVAFVESPWLALLVLLFYITVQQIESNILLPKIMQRQADILPLLAVFAVFAGGSIGGILGALIAVPLAGGLLVVITHVVLPQIHQRSGSPGILPKPDSEGSS